MSLSTFPIPSVGVSAILLLSIPHVRQLVADCGSKKAYRLIESSNGDESITSGKSPRSVWQRVTLVVVAAAATIAALWSCFSIQPVLAHNALRLATWVRGNAPEHFQALEMTIFADHDPSPRISPHKPSESRSQI
jgi:hypothetical protein